MNNSDAPGTLSNGPPRAARFLEQSLLFTIVAHGAGMLSMALILLPAMPGGPNVSDAARVAWIAAHPWLWRIGWFPWQATALSDLILALALLRTPWIPRLPAVLATLMTVAAVSVEQPNEFRWITTGLTLAQEAVRTSDLTAYLQFEGPTFILVGAWAALLYTIAALLWTWCFAGAKTWNRLLTWLSIVVWSVMLVITIGPLLPESYRLNNTLVAAGNAIGFVLLMLWLFVVTELVLRRSRPEAASGRMAPWHYPKRSLPGRFLDLVANSRLARAFGEWSPAVAYASDITNVIYINYLVDAALLEPLVPWGLELQRLGPNSDRALFTYLTYNHGHFGPAALGPLRRLMPSPVQSNWRIHVRDPRTGVLGIHFVSTALNHTLPALAARLLSEGIPMHLVKSGEVTENTVRLDPGDGSAPDVVAQLSPASHELPQWWKDCFTDYRGMLAYCVPQDRAMSSQPWYRRITRQEIQLGIPLESCEPLDGSVVSRAAHRIAGSAQPLCFRVAKVSFRFDREEYDLVNRDALKS